MKPKHDHGPRDPNRLKKMNTPKKKYRISKFIGTEELLVHLDCELQTDQQIADKVGLHRTTIRAIRLGRAFGKRTASTIVAKTGHREFVKRYEV